LNTKLKINKTSLYLAPCLKDYGEDFLKQYKKLEKVFIAIDDEYLKKTGTHYSHHLFIVFNSKKENVNNVLEWMKTQDYYEDDYVYNNLLTSNLHVLVIKIPEQHYSTIHNFKHSQYSKMYKKEELEFYFKHLENTNMSNIREILDRSEIAKKGFCNYLNEMYNVSLHPSELEGELDEPINLKKETLNGRID
jgi:hypothetical protein